jgi:outer membrane receptor protein involved in Fe transport
MVRRKMKYIAFFILCLLSMGFAFGQTKVTVSGLVKTQGTDTPIEYASVILTRLPDSSFVQGTLTNSEGRFVLPNVPSGEYVLRFQGMAQATQFQPLSVGSLSEYLDIGTVEMTEKVIETEGVVIEGRTPENSVGLEKQSFNMDQNMSQGGGSLLQAMQNLPGVTIDQGGKVQVRGSDKVTVLIDGKQTALTGFGSQAGLDNIPASAVERIEIIHNPSAKYDANGMAGIINIIYKKSEQNGFNGKVGMIGGVGMLTEKRENLPNIRPQYGQTPKINPSLSFNYRRKGFNWFFQGDGLLQRTLNKNEYIDRVYTEDSIVHGQFLENRDQLIYTVKTGVDWNIDDRNALTVSGLFNREGHIDRGDLPYFNTDLSNRRRLWLYYESEINKSANAAANFTHKFKQPGHKFDLRYNYTWHQEDEWFYFDNIYANYSSADTVHLLYDENVMDLNFDYVKPLKYGRFEGGSKLRWRFIPSNITFIPGDSTILDLNADGHTNYNEVITALYGNYVYERTHFELEAGLRMEYVTVAYTIASPTSVYQSSGYNYIQPFPNTRVAWKFNSRNKISLSYNRRVDRPDEVDLRMFPKYDDPEVLKVGNPTLRPQLTNAFELAYKTTWTSGNFYAAAYHRESNNILTRVVTQSPNSILINAITQNAGKGRSTGIELFLSQNIGERFTFNFTVNGYYNVIDSFGGVNAYPVDVAYTMPRESNTSGNAKVNCIIHLPKKFDIQLTGLYLAPDIIPQGKIASRYAIDFGMKKGIQKGKGEIFLNGSDILNTMRINKTFYSTGFKLFSNDLYETQVFRLGYSYKF